MDKIIKRTEIMPQVSVIMPVYNAGTYLGQAIKSVLEQTFDDFELIVIDDGSTDSSRDIILSFSDSRIKYHKNEENLGVIKSLNKAISICSGEFIIRMDADDICEPQRFEEQIRFMKKHPDTGLCGTWAKVIDSQNNISGKIVNQTSPEFISISLLFTIPLVHPSVCFRASILKYNLYDNVPHAEDYELWRRLNDQTKMANLPKYLLQYRWHNSNISKEKQTIQEESKKMVIRKELTKLNLNPDEEELRIHRLSFSLYSFGNKIKKEINVKDLKASEDWFATLLSANKNVKRYNQQAFIAFLWTRWIVLCLAGGQKQKILFPAFASYKPKVLYYLAKQVMLMAKK